MCCYAPHNILKVCGNRVIHLIILAEFKLLIMNIKSTSPETGMLSRDIPYNKLLIRQSSYTETNISSHSYYICQYKVLFKEYCDYFHL